MVLALTACPSFSRNALSLSNLAKALVMASASLGLNQYATITIDNFRSASDVSGYDWAT